MYCTPCYVVCLRSRHHTDVVAVFETERAALAQVRAWLPAATVPQGPPFGAGTASIQYGKPGAAVLVTRCLLELADPSDEDALDDPDPAHLTAADRRFLRVVDSLTPQERGAVQARALESEDA